VGGFPVLFVDANRVLEFADGCRLEGLARRLLEGVDPCLGMSAIAHCIAFRVLEKVGEKVSGLLSPALSEPRGGSNLAGIETRASLVDNEVRVYGEKVFATNAAFADHLLVLARTDGEYVLVLVPQSEAKVEPLELEAYRCSGISRVYMQGSRGRVVAGPGKEAYKLVLETLAESRVLVAALALGLAWTGLREAIDWAMKRNVFKYQAVSHRLARAYAELLAARSLVEKTVEDSMRGKLDWAATSAAKLVAVETGRRILEATIKTLAGYALHKNSKLPRLLLHLEALEPAEGTSDMQLEIIARTLERTWKKNTNN